MVAVTGALLADCGHGRETLDYILHEAGIPPGRCWWFFPFSLLGFWTLSFSRLLREVPFLTLCCQAAPWRLDFKFSCELEPKTPIDAYRVYTHLGRKLTI